jgi:hypothetical protein
MDKKAKQTPTQEKKVVIKSSNSTPRPVMYSSAFSTRKARR